MRSKSINSNVFSMYVPNATRKQLVELSTVKWVHFNSSLCVLHCSSQQQCTRLNALNCIALQCTHTLLHITWLHCRPYCPGWHYRGTQGWQYSGWQYGGQKAVPGFTTQWSGVRGEIHSAWDGRCPFKLLHSFPLYPALQRANSWSRPTNFHFFLK